MMLNWIKYCFGITSFVVVTMFLYFGLKNINPYQTKIIFNIKSIKNTKLTLEFDSLESTSKTLHANQFFLPTTFNHPQKPTSFHTRLYLGESDNTIYIDKVFVLYFNFSTLDTIYQWNCQQEIEKLITSTTNCNIEDKTNNYLEINTLENSASIDFKFNDALISKIKQYPTFPWYKLLLFSGLIALFIVAFITKNKETGERLVIQIKGKRKLMFPIIFLLIIGSISANSIFKILPDIKISENRSKTSLPKLNYNTVFNFTDDLTTYVSENFAFRNVFFLTNSIFCNKFFQESALPEKVILGKKGWLYYNDLGSISDYRRMTQLDTNLMRYIATTFTIRRNWLAKKNIKFYILTAPNKERIYPDYMPSYIRIIDGLGHNSLDYIKKYLWEMAKLEVIDPSDSLLVARRRRDVFYKTDTHWNTYGGFKGYQCLLNEISKDFSSLKVFQDEQFTIQETFNNEGDLSSMLGLNNIYPRKEYMMRFIDSNRKLDYNVPSEMILRYTNSIPDSSQRLKLLLFRDSFGSYLVPFLNQQFAETVIVWNYFFMNKLIEEEKPDIVVFESLQRFLVYATTMQNPTAVMHSNP